MSLFARSKSRDPEPGGNLHPDEWLTVEVTCEPFTLDLITARLESEGVEIRRSSLDGLPRTAGGPVWSGKQIGFRRADAAAVETAFRDADLL